MDRQGRWVEGGGGRRAWGANDPAYRWRGMALRPTGVVVFATLDTLDPEAADRSSHELGTPARSEPRATVRPSPIGTRARSHAPTHEWRRLASRSAAWLLGR
jgi:hypothetical protein